MKQLDKLTGGQIIALMYCSVFNNAYDIYFVHKSHVKLIYFLLCKFDGEIAKHAEYVYHGKPTDNEYACFLFQQGMRSTTELLKCQLNVFSKSWENCENTSATLFRSWIFFLFISLNKIPI